MKCSVPFVDLIVEVYWLFKTSSNLYSSGN